MSRNTWGLEEFVNESSKGYILKGMCFFGLTNKFLGLLSFQALVSPFLLYVSFQ